MAKHTANVGLRLPADWKVGLDDLAAKANMSLSEYLRAAVFSWLVLQYDKGDQDILPIPSSVDDFYRYWGSHFAQMGHLAWKMAETISILNGNKRIDNPRPTRFEHDQMLRRYPKEFDEFVKQLYQKEREHEQTIQPPPDQHT